MYLAWKQGACQRPSLIEQPRGRRGAGQDASPQGLALPRPGWAKRSTRSGRFSCALEIPGPLSIVTIILDGPWSHHSQCTARRTGKTQTLTMNPATESTVLFPRLAGNAGLLRSLDRGGWVMPTLIIVGPWMVIPYIDTKPSWCRLTTLGKQRKFAIGTFLFGFIILWGFDDFSSAPSSGRPGMASGFWPGRTWDHKPGSFMKSNRRTWPDLFGINLETGAKGQSSERLRGRRLPSPSAASLVHAFFRRNNPKDYKRMSLLQYSILMTFCSPLFRFCPNSKMMLRFTFPQLSTCGLHLGSKRLGFSV